MFAVVKVHIKIIRAVSGKEISFNYVNSFTVNTSTKTFTDTAKIVIPRKLSHKGVSITELIRRGDKIEIWAGWEQNGAKLQVVDWGGVKFFGKSGTNLLFKGYITSVGTGTPLTIDCENEAWELKQIKLPAKHYARLSLKDFVNEFMSDYQTEIVDIELWEVIINKEVTLSEVFSYFMKNYPLSFFFREGKFFGVLTSSMMSKSGAVKTVKFAKGVNIAKESLQYTLAEDVKLQIIAKTILKDNTKLEWKEPVDLKDCEVRTFFVPSAKTLADLEQYAKNMLETFKIDKMTGSITACAIPYVRKGDIIHLFDDEFPERNDKKFFAEAVNYSLSTGSGLKQNITLGFQVQ